MNVWFLNLRWNCSLRLLNDNRRLAFLSLWPTYIPKSDHLAISKQQSCNHEQPLHWGYIILFWWDSKSGSASLKMFPKRHIEKKCYWCDLNHSPARPRRVFIPRNLQTKSLKSPVWDSHCCHKRSEPPVIFIHEGMFEYDNQWDANCVLKFTWRGSTWSWGSVLPWKSLEVVLTVLIVSIVLRKAVRDPPGLALRMLLVLLVLLVVIVGLWRGVIKPGGIPVLRHGAYVCEEGLRRASVLVRQVSQAARQVRRRRHAVAFPAGHLVRGPLHRRAEEALIAWHSRLPAGRHRVGGGTHVRQRDLCASRYCGSMTDEWGHKICRKANGAGGTLQT